MKYKKIVFLLIIMIMGIILINKREQKESKAFKQTMLLFHDITRDLSGIKHGQFFSMSLVPRLFLPLRDLPRGQPYTPIKKITGSYDIAFELFEWRLLEPYEYLSIHNLVLELEDGRQVELLDKGILRYTLPPMTQLKNHQYNLTRISYMEKYGLTENQYAFDAPAYRDEYGEWSHLVAIFPQIRKEVIGVDLVETPKIAVDTWITLIMTYSFDDEEIHYKEKFLFHGFYGKPEGYSFIIP